MTTRIWSTSGSTFSQFFVFMQVDLGFFGWNNCKNNGEKKEQGGENMRIQELNHWKILSMMCVSLVRGRCNLGKQPCMHIQ